MVSVRWDDVYSCEECAPPRPVGDRRETGYKYLTYEIESEQPEFCEHCNSQIPEVIPQDSYYQKAYSFIKDEWIPALESGEYKQGAHSLRILEPEQYCCLGVANELLPENEKSDWFLCLLSEHSVLPKVLDEIYPLEGQNTLSEMNDTGSSFKQIAEELKKTALPYLESKLSNDE